jgi:hypothetical protein
LLEYPYRDGNVGGKGRGERKEERGGGKVAPCKCTTSTENISGVSSFFIDRPMHHTEYN